jgi:hypothetical protein
MMIVYYFSRFFSFGRFGFVAVDSGFVLIFKSYTVFPMEPLFGWGSAMV